MILYREALDRLCVRLNMYLVLTNNFSNLGQRHITFVVLQHCVKKLFQNGQFIWQAVLTLNPHLQISANNCRYL